LKNLAGTDMSDKLPGNWEKINLPKNQSSP